MTCKRILTIAGVLTLFCIGGLATYTIGQAFQSRVESEVLDSTEQAVAQTAINLADRMHAIETLSQMIASDSRVRDSIMRREGEESMENQLTDIEQLREVVSTAMAREDVALMRMYISGAKMLSRERVNFYPLSEVGSLPEYREDAWGGHWVGEHEIATLGFQGSVISYSFALRGASFDQLGALVIIDADVERFRDVIASLSLPGDESEGSVFLMDASGALVLEDGRRAVSEDLARRIAGKSSRAGFLQTDAGEMAYIQTPLGESGWRLVAALPRRALFADSQLLRPAMLSAILAMALFSAFGAASLAFASYARDVRRQISDIQRSLESSGQAARAQNRARKDLFQLNRHITELLNTAARAREEVYNAQLREREATLRALQAQINPHFLYNTLDTINWMALEANAPKVSHMIETLGYYYRMSLSKGQDVICLYDEVSLVKAYLSLQSERFDHEFSVSWNIAEEAETCQIPKLTLQPLVENALLHGICKRRKMEGALIEIYAYEKEGRLYLTILDNGPGLAQKQAGAGYGLTNVRQRLELFSNGQYRLSLANRPEGGLRAEISLPARKSMDRQERLQNEE